MTTRAAEIYVTSPTVPRALAGFYLGKIWRKCLIRRTYESKDPRDPMGPLISGSLPRLEIRRIECSFSNEEQMFYNLISKEPHARLSHWLENGQVVWNRKYTRQLLLYCNWLKFFYISNSMMAASVPTWKASQNLLHDIVKAVWKKTEKDPDPETRFELPEKDDVSGLLACVCTGSPKVRALLRIIAELVVIKKKKVIIWCCLPAVQLLLLGIFRALQIDAIAYTADLSMDERGDVQKAFNEEKEKAMISSAPSA
jgi:hypothetical protein